MSRHHGETPKRRRAGGGAAGPSQKKPYFDDLSEDLIGDVMRFLSVRDLDVARFPCKVFNLVAQRFVAWIGEIGRAHVRTPVTA